MRALMRRWFVSFHGEGAPNQYDLYRCSICRGVVTHRMIKRGDTCVGAQLRPTNPTFWERLTLMVRPT
jgi:hypothetical protein